MVENKAGPTTSYDGLLDWHQIEPWQRDNEYIKTGYRKASRSYAKSVASILRWHNETVNIWSHLIGTGLFLALLWDFTSRSVPHLQQATNADIAVLVIFYLAVAVCFSLSTTFHLFSDHSREMHKFGNELDHLGIVFVMWGSGVPSDYFGFYCDHRVRNTYWFLVTSIAIACAIFTLRPKFREPTYRTMRFLMYCFLGTSLFVPVFHGIYVNGWTIQNKWMSLQYFFGLGLFQFCGAAIYAGRTPERWFPKTFDFVGSSHNILHVLVIFGAISHLIGLLKALDYWTTLRKSGIVCKYM